MKVLLLLLSWCWICFAGTPGHQTVVVRSYSIIFSQEETAGGYLPSKLLLFVIPCESNSFFFLIISLTFRIQTLVAFWPNYQTAQKTSSVLEKKPSPSPPNQTICIALQFIRALPMTITTVYGSCHGINKTILGRRIMIESVWIKITV